MRKESSLVFDERDEEIASLFMDLGLARSVARALVFLSQVDEAVSTDVETGANLRQPEVSVAMQALRAREWVVKRDLKKEGKGRPVHCYRLARPLAEIIEEIEREKRAAAERDLAALARLRGLSSPSGR